MASKIIVDQLESSGSNITIPTGTGLVVTDGIAATNLSGTIADARLPTVPVTKGGTGLTSLGSANQVVKVNSGGNALEFGAVAGGIISSHSNVQTGTTAYSNTAFTDSHAPRVTITPASTSSKFLIIATGLMFNQRANYYSALTLFRELTGGASTNLATTSGGDMLHVRTYHSNEVYAPYAMTFLDAPNTTTELKYTVKYRAESNSDTARINNNNTQSQIVVLEF